MQTPGVLNLVALGGIKFSTLVQLYVVPSKKQLHCSHFCSSFFIERIQCELKELLPYQSCSCTARFAWVMVWKVIL